jgi:hypothetical protein
MNRKDVEIVIEYMNDAVRGDVESEAYSRTLDAWADDRPDDLETLEAAHDDEDSSFQWENVGFQKENRGRDRGDELVPMTGVEPVQEDDIHGLAHDFAADYLTATIERVREMQDETDYSPRQFVALVLDAADNTPEEVAASVMDISVGNYRGKLGDVKEKHETAEETVSVTDRVRA